MANGLWTAMTALCLLACLASFIWSMNHFFIKPSGKSPGMSLIKLCGILFGALHLVAVLWPGVVTPERACIAIALYAGALALFWSAIAANKRSPLSAAFSSDLPVRVVQHGPYRYIRHPFYASYLLVWIAGPLAAGQPWLLSTALIMLAIYIVAAKSEERKFAGSPMAAQYEHYQARTGMFAPNPFKLIGAANPEIGVPNAE